MQKTFFTIAGHKFAITMTEGDILSLLPNLEPFMCDSTDDLLFEITSDNSIQPSWRGEKVGTFPCPSATFEVYRQDSGAYQILTMNEYRIPCAFMQSDAARRCFTIATRGNHTDVVFGFNNTLMVIFTMCTAPHKTLLMHSATVENSGKGYMFLGASGQGRRKESAASLDGGAIKVLLKQKRLPRVRQPLIVMCDMSEHYVFVIDIE